MKGSFILMFLILPGVVYGQTVDIQIDTNKHTSEIFTSDYCMVYPDARDCVTLGFDQELFFSGASGGPAAGRYKNKVGSWFIDKGKLNVDYHKDKYRDRYGIKEQVSIYTVLWAFNTNIVLEYPIRKVWSRLLIIAPYDSLKIDQINIKLSKVVEEQIGEYELDESDPFYWIDLNDLVGKICQEYLSELKILSSHKKYWNDMHIR